MSEEVNITIELVKLAIRFEENGECHIKKLTLEQMIDLYNKEKEKNKKLKQDRDEYKEDYIKLLNARYYNYISKDKIRELLQRYDKGIAWANADDHYYFVKFIKELLEEQENENSIK